MDQTTNLKLPYIMPSQAQKHVTHNEAIRALDALVQLCVLDRDLSRHPPRRSTAAAIWWRRGTAHGPARTAK